MPAAATLMNEVSSYTTSARWLPVQLLALLRCSSSQAACTCPGPSLCQTPAPRPSL